MAKRTNRVAAGLAVVLAVGVLGGCGFLLEHGVQLGRARLHLHPVPFCAVGVADVVPHCGDGCRTSVPAVGHAVWLGPRAFCWYRHQQLDLKPDEHCVQPDWVWFPRWPPASTR
jgi:hypothetical protein